MASAGSMSSMSGTVALVGAGEYLAPMDPVDRDLLERLPGPPRVVVLPTAAAPDGPGVPERWASMGIEHFTRLGAVVDPVMLLTRADADSPELAAQIAAANMVYLSGGKPRYLLETLQDSACWRAIQGVLAAGGVVAGCSAGAMVLGSALVDWPQVWHTLPALGVAPNLLIMPHFDELPARMFKPVLTLASRSQVIAGVDGMTALIGSGGQWRVAGRGHVTIFPGDGASHKYAAGESVPLPAAE